MARNTVSTSPSTFTYKCGQTFSSSSDQLREPIPADDCDGLESDNDTFIALSSLPKMAIKRGSYQNEDGSLSPQVHQLMFLVQQYVARDVKYEHPETDDQSYRPPCDVQHEVSEPVRFAGRVDENRPQQQEIGDETELCSRMEELAIYCYGGDENIECRITDERAHGRSNQDEVDTTKHVEDRDSSKPETENLDELVKQAKLSTATTSRLRVHPIMTANMTVKGIRVPQLPRGRDEGYSGSEFGNAKTCNPDNIHAKDAGENFRYRFRFSEKEVLQLLDDDEASAESALNPALFNTYRRLSTNSKIIVAVPLRRNSFSMKRNSLKSFGGFGSAHVANIATPEVAGASALSHVTKSATNLWTVRRKSTSACHIIASSMPLSRRNSSIFSVTKQQILGSSSKKKVIASPSKSTSGPPRSSSASSSPSPVPTTQNQILLRVRERMSDGVPELVIVKKPVHFVMWHWNDRCVCVPFMNATNYMELGPAQHDIMLRQLRYIKLMMYELPWAKAHLRALLSKYTAKELSKKELYPQLNALGEQVQSDISSRAKQHHALIARKHRLKVTLTLATSVVNDTKMSKSGRRGRPHTSRLLYDPTFPLQLRWRRKHGEWSTEYLAVDEIQVIEGSDDLRATSGAETFGRETIKTVAVLADPESCLSFVTPTRSLNLQVASSLHREWLANAMRDLVSFAQQHEAIQATTDIVMDNNS
ncbi:hypothetical protein DD238_005703 [Peronospora effusa]|uniref:PH domain-containing protein n=1 Tax=Peronospora effusa TaxID=542832 RepID=A0A3M6VBW8_9STRA|nr:hypothetical protein DD238_005703 [Peronospora effusa]